MIHVVVAYDIPDDRRRNRLAKCLKGYGLRVNYSVFECVLRASDLARMEAKLKKLILPKTDSLRIYPLCRACAGKVSELGSGPDGFEQSSLVYI